MILSYDQTEDGAEGEAQFDRFDATIEFLVNGVGSRSDAETGVAALNELTDAAVTTALTATAQYRHVCEPAAPPMASTEELIDSLEPLALVIWPDGDGVAISVEFACSWEQEHGMEWYFVNGRPRYVGPAIGESPRNDAFTPNYLT
jgi:hypothetical protein